MDWAAKSDSQRERPAQSAVASPLSGAQHGAATAAKRAAVSQKAHQPLARQDNLEAVRVATCQQQQTIHPAGCLQNRRAPAATAAAATAAAAGVAATVVWLSAQ